MSTWTLRDTAMDDLIVWCRVITVDPNFEFLTGTPNPSGSYKQDLHEVPAYGNEGSLSKSLL